MYLRAKSRSSVKSRKEWVVELMRNAVRQCTPIKNVGSMSYKRLKANYTKISRFKQLNLVDLKENLTK